MNLTKLFAISILVLASTLAAVWWGWMRPGTGEVGEKVAMEVLQAQPADDVEVVDVRQMQGMRGLSVQFTGNGRERMVAMIRNERGRAVSIRLRPGIIFEPVEPKTGAVALVEGGFLTIGPRTAEPYHLRTVALASSNRVEAVHFMVTNREVEEVKPIFRQITRLPVYSTGAVQTAVLAVLENLPLSAFAQFPLMSGERLQSVDTEAYRVPVAAIIQGLQLMRDAGYDMDLFALPVDPQLVVEAMVDPMARHAARKYYGMEERYEWLFWREMLTNGPLSLRHYALHGIARFYPEIALDMHPQWIRSVEVGPVMRQAAINSLAETGHPEVLPILAQLQYEFRSDPVVLAQIVAAERYVQQAMRFRREAARSQLVAFRYQPLEPREMGIGEAIGPIPY